MSENAKPSSDPRMIPGAPIKLVIVTEKGEKTALRCRLLPGVTSADVDKAMQRGVLRIVPDQG